MTQRNPLAASVQRALVLGIASTAAIGAPTFAQTAPAGEEAQTLDAVVVTGSRIRRVDAETATPVFTIDAAAIDRTGAATIGDFLQDIPAISGAATNPSVNNGGGTGEATVSLRGIGDERTLTLLNGRRMVYNDINSIPMAAIARVEVLKGGASAIYGTDAIGGVVNFILKRDFDGGELSVGYGQSSEGDAERTTGNVTYGWSGERGNVLLNLNYNDQREVLAADREYSRNALTLYSGTVTVGGSSRTTTGRYSVPRTNAAANGINCAGTGATVALTRIAGRPGTQWSDFRCFNNATDLFNYQAVGNLQLTPQERAGAFFSGRFNINDNVTAYAELYNQSTRAYGQIAPLPFDARPGQDEVTISPNSVFWPFAGLTGGLVGNDLRLRLSAIGNRRFSFNTDVTQISTGFEGAIGDSSWSYDVGMTYGKLEQSGLSTGYLFTPALASALGPSFRDAGGVIRCGTPAAPIANCTPVNFFGDLSSPADQAALARISSPSINKTDATLKNFYANASGDLFELPAGVVGGAFGVEYRKESSAFEPSFLAVVDPTNYTCLISSEACTTRAVGEFDVTEVYGEVLFPLLADAPLAQSLNAIAGARWSDYSTFGSTTNWKVGLEWRPIDGLLVRGTVDKVFRAPTIDDLFQGDSASSDSFSDPCNRWRGAPVGSPQRLACANVPTDGTFNQTDTQLSAIKGGNSTLQPEEGKVFTYGVIYDPSWLEGASVSVDLWRIYLNDTIGTVGTQTILNNCFNNGQFCNLFSRNASGEILRLFDRNANVGRTDTKGVDFGLKYRLEDTAFGSFQFSLDTTYTAQFDVKTIVLGQVVAQQYLAGTFLSSANGGLGNYSRVRSLGSLGWSMGDWDAQWTSRYVSGFSVGAIFPNTRTNVCADLGLAIVAGGTPGCQFDRGSQTYHNLQVGYNLESWKTKFQIGVDNVFDKQPPIIYQNNSLNGNTDERTFDTVGRYYWATATVKF
ncbi:TonB-dependent receptor [Silanimonas sp.]|uniref:TonB-dependent receptor plug domain-containing protein n=1 Tax=Silanimonas sp. TaxID=1929290 RepID=UPI0022BDF7A0|nr:TonB-dependent receptor [Silanimonas sp.]MCZ8063656.1 TonB-dependent receptor [Silanimonas sp.]